MKDLTADSDANATTTIQTMGSNSSTYATAIEMDMLKAMVHEATATLTAWEHGEAWWKAQYMKMTPDQQAMYHKDKGEMDSEKEGDMEKENSDTEGEVELNEETDDDGETDVDESAGAESEGEEEAEEAASFDDFFMLFRKKVFRF